MPIVSIVVPVHNTMQWLAECVESIRNQTLQDIEIILVDDGSTDYSGAICDAYADMDNRIRVIHQENKGVSAARNIGMDIASGKYIMFCDSDDYVAPEWCASAVELAEMYPNALVTLSYVQIDRNGLHKIIYRDNEALSILKHGEYAGILKNIIALPVWNKIFRKDNIRQYELKFQETVSYGEDFLFVAEYLNRVSSIIVKNDVVLYFYRCWSANTLSARFLGIGFFQFYIHEAEIAKHFITTEEMQDYFRWFFWVRGIGSLARVLDSRNPDSLEKQKQDCQKMIQTGEFREWCRAALTSDPANALPRLLLQGDFEKAYEPVVQYLKQTGKRI